MLQNIQTEFAEQLIESLQGNSALPLHFKIYQHNIRTSLLNVLSDIYPLLIKLLGRDFFSQSMQDYIRNYPSRSSNLHDYGEYVADFLMEYSSTSHLPYLSEVAQFEWLCHGIQFAAQHPPFDIQKLESVPAEKMESLRFILNPAAVLQRFHYPILRIIDLCNGEIDENIHLAEGGVNLLILRREFEIKLISLTATEFVFLQAINESHPLSESLKAANLVAGEAPFKLEEKLPQWVQDQILVDCY